MNMLTDVGGNDEESYKILENPYSLPNVEILQRSENRRKTDRAFLYVFIACAVLLLPFLIYTLCYSDINRLKGYDKCGNICGQKNYRYYQWSCTGQDMTLKPLSGFNRECFERSNSFSDRSYLDGEKIFSFLHRAVWKVVLVSFLPLALCLVLTVLFRYAPEVAVWSILLLSWLLFTALLIFLLVSFINPFAIPFVIIMVIKLWISFFNLCTIRLATALLKEATKAVFEVNMMIYVSIGVLAVLLIILLIHSTVTFHIQTAGRMVEFSSDFIVFKPDDAMLATIFLFAILAFWAAQFVLGAHDMTVSGAITKWYTTKDQNNLNDAVPNSIRVMFKYHLGTIALGSALKVVMFAPRLIFVILSWTSGMNDWLMRGIDSFFTSKLNIVTGMYGTSFIQSGKEVVKLLKFSIGNTTDICSFGCSVIALGQILVMFFSTLAAYLTLNFSLGFQPGHTVFFTLVELGIASIYSHAILGTLKTASITIFFCATEEFLNNKEADLPYTMTMKEFLDGSNRLFFQKLQSKPPLNLEVRSFCIKMFLFIFACVCILLLFGAFMI